MKFLVGWAVGCPLMKATLANFSSMRSISAWVAYENPSLSLPVYAHWVSNSGSSSSEAHSSSEYMFCIASRSVMERSAAGCFSFSLRKAAVTSSRG